MYQKLMTKEVETLLGKYGIYSQEKKPFAEKKVLVKFFNPYGVGTWIITEGEKQENGDWLLHGFCELGNGYEEGDVMYSEIRDYRNRLGLGLERDQYLPKNCKVGDLITEKDLM